MGELLLESSIGGCLVPVRVEQDQCSLARETHRVGPTFRLQRELMGIVQSRFDLAVCTIELIAEQGEAEVAEELCASERIFGEQDLDR
jgi:hypothetical protein